MILSPDGRSDRAGGKRRLAYLTNIPSPYRAVMVRAWAALNPDLAISVFYTDPDDQGRNWAADAIGDSVREVRLPVLANLGRYGKFNRSLVRMVRDNDVIMIGGFEQASYLAAAVLARMQGKPVILLSDGFSPARFGTEPAPILALKRVTARFADGFFANGTVGARYLREQIGVGADRPIRNQFLSHSDLPIQQARDSLSGLTKAQIRQRLGIPADEGRLVLLSCGYLIRRKRNDLVIDAIARLPREQRPLFLLVGSGEEAEVLRAQADRAGVDVHFAGFKLGRDLTEHYFAADALVLASDDDPWGLVVNEAMAAGLPVLVSDACGAALDMVDHGANGFVFRTGDDSDLATKLARLLTADGHQLGQASRRKIAEWTPDHSARNLSAIVAAVCHA